MKYLWIKILTLFMVSLFPCLSVGMCEPGINYDYIDPEVDTQWNVDQVFLVKNIGLTVVDSFPSLCTDTDDTLAESKNLQPNQTFMIVGRYLVYQSSDRDGYYGPDGYFKVALIQGDGTIDMKHTGWIHMGDFHKMKKISEIEKIKGKILFQKETDTGR